RLRLVAGIAARARGAVGARVRLRNGGLVVGGRLGPLGVLAELALGECEEQCEGEMHWRSSGAAAAAPGEKLRTSWARDNERAPARPRPACARPRPPGGRREAAMRRRAPPLARACAAPRGRGRKAPRDRAWIRFRRGRASRREAARPAA